MAPPISENACFVPEAGRRTAESSAAQTEDMDTGIGIQCHAPGRPGQRRERGETDGRRTSILNGCFAIWEQ